LLKKKGANSHLGDGIRLRKKIKRAWREKKIFLKKRGTNSHLSDGEPFDKKLNAHGVKRRFA